MLHNLSFALDNVLTSLISDNEPPRNSMDIGFVWDDRTIEANISLISIDTAVNRTNHTVKTNSKSDNVSTEEKPKDCYSFEEEISDHIT